MKNKPSKHNLKNIYQIFLGAVVIPTFILAVLGILGVGLKTIGSTEGVVLILSLIPTVFYVFVSYRKLKLIDFTSISDNRHFPQELGITFYISFLIFMITILFSFNLIITGLFLLNGEVPMGMQAVPSDAPTIIVLSLYLFFSGILGIYYLVHSKRILRPRKTVY